MSVQAMAWAYSQKAGSPAAKLLLVTLANVADEEGYSWPGRAWLAEQCEMSESSVKRMLTVLVEAGLLVRIFRQRPNGSQTTNGYQLMLMPRGVQSEPPGGPGVTPGGAQGGPPVPISRTTKRSNPPIVPPLVLVTAPPAVDHFGRFWAVYPRKVAKPAAARAWKAAMNRGGDPDRIVDAARAYRDEGHETKYTAHPATWLNQERYNDAPEPPDDPGVGETDWGALGTGDHQ